MYGGMDRFSKESLTEYLSNHPWIHSTQELTEHFDCSRAYVHRMLTELETEKKVVSIIIGKSLGWISAIPPENPKRIAQWHIIITAISLQTRNKHSLVKDPEFPSRLLGRLGLIAKHIQETFSLSE